MYVYMENDCLHTYYLEKYYQIPFKLKKYPLRDSEIPIALEDFLLKNFNIQEFVFSSLTLKLRFLVGKLHMVLGNGVYIDTLNLMPRIQNQIRSLAAFDNPEFYKNKRLGYSNYYNFSAVYLGKDIDGYIQIPRGLRENIIQTDYFFKTCSCFIFFCV